MILSVDLASRRYADNGIALMREDGKGGSHVTLLSPESLHLGDPPDASRLCAALLELAAREEVRLILIDGPQAWRSNTSPLPHARVCERETRTPGKTGLPGVVLPRGWTRMALFSIALFDRLHEAGWPRLTADWRGEPATIESFPTHAWRCLGHTALPGKSRAPDLSPWREHLATAGVVSRHPTASHDDLQAIVAGLAGIQMLTRGLASCDVRGVPPCREDGIWREGFIVSPTPSSGNGRCSSAPIPSPAPTSGAR